MTDSAICSKMDSGVKQGGQDEDPVEASSKLHLFAL